MENDEDEELKQAIAASQEYYNSKQFEGQNQNEAEYPKMNQDPLYSNYPNNLQGLQDAQQFLDQNIEQEIDAASCKASANTSTDVCDQSFSRTQTDIQEDGEYVDISVFNQNQQQENQQKKGNTPSVSTGISSTEQNFESELNLHNLNDAQYLNQENQQNLRNMQCNNMFRAQKLQDIRQKINVSIHLQRLQMRTKHTKQIFEALSKLEQEVKQISESNQEKSCIDLNLNRQKQVQNSNLNKIEEQDLAKQLEEQQF